MRAFLTSVAAAALLLLSLEARAIEEPASPAPAPAAAPAPYSLPWQLRSVALANLVRSDTTLAFFQGGGKSGETLATTLLGCWKVTSQLGLLARVAYVVNAPPTGETTGVLSNPAVGATWVMVPAPNLKLAFFLGLALPLGQGGGNDATAAALAAEKAGAAARSAMDNALFAVNDLTVYPGLDLAWVQGGFTAQVEATVLQLTRVRGETKQADASKTNLTAGLHLGWFALPSLSVGGELRMQRWLSTPAAVVANPAARETVTAALGLRWHHKFANGTVVRPGLAYVQALDDPLAAAHYRIVQLDVPVIF